MLLCTPPSLPHTPTGFCTQSADFTARKPHKQQPPCRTPRHNVISDHPPCNTIRRTQCPGRQTSLRPVRQQQARPSLDNVLEDSFFGGLFFFPFSVPGSYVSVPETQSLITADNKERAPTFGRLCKKYARTALFKSASMHCYNRRTHKHKHRQNRTVFGRKYRNINFQNSTLLNYTSTSTHNSAC